MPKMRTLKPADDKHPEYEDPVSQQKRVKKRIQNRNAQRSFREKQAAYIRTLEKMVNDVAVPARGETAAPEKAQSCWLEEVRELQEALLRMRRRFQSLSLAAASNAGTYACRVRYSPVLILTGYWRDRRSHLSKDFEQPSIRFSRGYSAEPDRLSAASLVGVRTKHGLDLAVEIRSHQRLESGCRPCDPLLRRFSGPQCTSCCPLLRPRFHPTTHPVYHFRYLTHSLRIIVAVTIVVGRGHRLERCILFRRYSRRGADHQENIGTMHQHRGC